MSNQPRETIPAGKVHEESGKATERTRAKLLAAAGEVFARAGYYNATIREICALAGANVAAVNYHFRDKLGLYTEVLRKSVGVPQNQAVLKMFEQDTPPSEVLRHVIRAMVQRMCGTDRHELNLRFQLMAQELARPMPVRSCVIDEAVRPIYTRMLALISSMLGLPPDDPKTRLCTHSVVGQIAHYVHARPVVAQLWPQQKMTPEQLDQIAEHIADFSLSYLEKAARNRRNKPARNVKRRK